MCPPHQPFKDAQCLGTPFSAAFIRLVPEGIGEETRACSAKKSTRNDFPAKIEIVVVSRNHHPAQFSRSGLFRMKKKIPPMISFPAAVGRLRLPA